MTSKCLQSSSVIQILLAVCTNFLLADDRETFFFFESQSRTFIFPEFNHRSYIFLKTQQCRIKVQGIIRTTSIVASICSFIFAILSNLAIYSFVSFTLKMPINFSRNRSRCPPPAKTNNVNANDFFKKLKYYI